MWPLRQIHFRPPGMCGSRRVFFRGGPTFIFFSWWEDPNTTKSGPTLAGQRNAIWRANDGPTLNTGLVALWFYRGSGPVLLRNPFCDFSGGEFRPPVLPSGSAHARGLIWKNLVDATTLYKGPRPSGFGQEEFWSFCFWLPWQPEFCMEWKSFSNFERGPPKDHPCEVWWNSTKRILLTDGHPMITKPHLEHGRIQRGGEGVCPPPPPWKITKKGFLSYTSPDPLKIIKLRIQHSMFGHHRPASETPFKWRFAGRQLVAR